MRFMGQFHYLQSKVLRKCYNPPAMIKRRIERPLVSEQYLPFFVEASKILSSSIDYDVTLANVARLVITTIADLCDIFLFEGEVLNRVVVMDSDIKKNRIVQAFHNYPPNPEGKQGSYYVGRTGRPLFVSPMTEEYMRSISVSEEDYQSFKKMGYKASIMVPLIARGRIIGVLWIAARRLFDETDLTLAQELANRAAIAVDNAKLYKEAQDAVRMRDEFLSIASHELKTPLTSITLQLQMALKNINNRRKMPREKIAKVLASADKQTAKLQRLIKDLLNVSLITTGRVQLEKEKVDFSELVEETIERFDHSLKLNNYVVSKTIKPKVVGKMDRVRIEQVVGNLITNAIKYGGKKPFSVEVFEKKGNAVLVVKDKGIGIKEKHQNEIFERFNRGVNAKDYRGLGVGLYISKQIVEAHGGSIDLVSIPKKGSTFTVTLPLR
jgi:signal transduction histidine kinase